MKKTLRSAVVALMGLGLLVSATACSNGEGGAAAPVVPKIENAAVEKLDASGATTNVTTEDQFMEVLGELMMDPIFDDFSPKKSMGPVFKSVASVSADYDYGDDYDYGYDDYKDDGILSEFRKKVTDFMNNLMVFDNSGNSKASLEIDQTVTLEDLDEDLEDVLDGTGSLSLKANLSGTGKTTVSTSSNTSKTTFSFSGSVSEAVNVEVTPAEELGSSLKKVIAASAGTVTLSGVKATQTVKYSDDYTTTAATVSASGTIGAAVAASMGTSVCTSEGLGGKVVVSAEGVATASVSKIVDIVNEYMSSDDRYLPARDVGYVEAGEESMYDKVMEAVTVKFGLSVKFYSDDGVETFAKSFASVEELMNYFGKDLVD